MATRTRKPAAKKVVVVLYRVAFKNQDRVIYFSKSSRPLKDDTYIMKPHGIVVVDGVEHQSICCDGERYLVYQTVFVNGQCVGCNCGARNGNCKHRQQLSVIEAQRRQQADERTTEPSLPSVVAPLTTLPRAEFYVREAPTTNHPSVDLSACGNLNGARGFSVMAVAL
jgi:hypothetical protein